jgi:predicted nucleotidyltransferase
MQKLYNESIKSLKHHQLVLNQVINFFKNIPGVTGCFLSGSTAAGKMDEDSDLDIGFLFNDSQTRDDCWHKRWNWDIYPWFHRFDADHIKPYFIIYFFEPKIKTDINLYVEEDLPKAGDGRFSVIWDNDSILKKWFESLPALNKSIVVKDLYIHEDEQFWAWLFYLYSHVHRGEYYNCASEFSMIRNIVEKWTARLMGYSSFSSRKLEQQEYSSQLIRNELFPQPTRESIKKALLKLVEMQLKLRQDIGENLKVSWKTMDQAVDKITKFVESL